MAQISFSGYTITNHSLNKDCPETRAIQGSAARKGGVAIYVGIEFGATERVNDFETAGV
jgi:hypothetical protein